MNAKAPARAGCTLCSLADTSMPSRELGALVSEQREQLHAIAGLHVLACLFSKSQEHFTHTLHTPDNILGVRVR